MAPKLTYEDLPYLFPKVLDPFVYEGIRRHDKNESLRLIALTCNDNKRWKLRI
jgi:hypothetical protein